MATPDHTAPADFPDRPASGDSDPTAIHVCECNGHCSSIAAASPHSRASKLADIAFANHVMACLLDDSEKHCAARTLGDARTDAAPWPLTPETVEALYVAMCYLNQHADGLMRDASG